MADIHHEHLTDGDKLCISDDGKYTVTGDGIFDNLMEAVNKHLTAQYKLNRLAGEKYGDVYLGSMQSALAGAIQFILSEQKADKEADLIHEKITTEILNQELIKLKHETERLTHAQLKANTELAKANTALVNAKICTEKAQACGPGPVDGTVQHAQMELYKEQTEGFQRNSEQNYLKAVLNAWAANANVLGDGMCEVAAFQSRGLDSLIKSIGSKIGVSIPGPDGSICIEEDVLRAQVQHQKDAILRKIADENAKTGGAPKT